MADSEGMADVIVPALDEIQNMKVTDLRKKLKAFGLPITGNKTELVDRLQEACKGSDNFDNTDLSIGELEDPDHSVVIEDTDILEQEHFSSFTNSSLEDYTNTLDQSGRLDSFDSSQLNFDEGQISPDGCATIEDGDMLEQDHFSSYINSSIEDDSKVLSNTENKLNLSSTTVTKPLKKRTISKSSNETPVTEKKVILNRTNVALAEFNIKPVSNITSETDIMNDKSETENKKVLTVKNMSAAERLAMRAKRFNISNAAVAANLKSVNFRNSKQGILSSAPVTPDLEVLKKRAERFGQCVSTVMKQIEQKEKLLKRKCKFGANLSVSATSSLDELEKKRRRAERFGVS